VSASRSRSAPPSLRWEQALLRNGIGSVAGLDEVGRGALAGPVVVGVVVVDLTTPSAPRGVRDSKLLSPQQRRALRPQVQQWVREWAVGSASAAEIDQLGIVAALGHAARRAWQQLEEPPPVVLLDGTHDYISPAFLPSPNMSQVRPCPRVLTRVQADRSAASVAAASILAKVARDAQMTELARLYPDYGWETNSGYGTRSHREAVIAHGVTELHRRSFCRDLGSD
jgi:ribonuclease HII